MLMNKTDGICVLSAYITFVYVCICVCVCSLVFFYASLKYSKVSPTDGALGAIPLDFYSLDHFFHLFF